MLRHKVFEVTYPGVAVKDPGYSTWFPINRINP